MQVCKCHAEASSVGWLTHLVRISPTCTLPACRIHMQHWIGRMMHVDIVGGNSYISRF